jgi:hypothetical protein
MPQLPALQVAVPLVPLHTVPQAPQLVTSVLMFFSQPFAIEPSQLAKPELQLAITHVPFEQAPTPLATLQLVPQAPQLFTLVEVLTSQPSAALPLQSAIGAVQVTPVVPH